MIMAVVGSVNLEVQPSVVELIKGIFLEYLPEVFVSGGALGIDTISEGIFKRMFPYKRRIVFKPEVRNWAHPRGFRWRNIKVARTCDKLVCIRSENSGTYGSGWTADYTERLGKPVTRYLVTADYMVHPVDNYARRRQNNG